jgi:hypothetical protein
VTRVGSELALDVLQSGAVRAYPNYARHLARVALALLCQPDFRPRKSVSTDQRLALVSSDSLAPLYEEILQLYVGQTEVDRTLGAWPLLIRLIDRADAWATRLAEQHWPADQPHAAQNHTAPMARITGRVLVVAL